MTSVSTDRRQGLNSSAAIKVPCRAGTTANIVLSGLQTIDNIVLAAGDRVLVKNQTTTTENGIYIADTGNWSRDLDFDGPYDIVEGTLIEVNNGTVNASTVWRVTTTSPSIGAALAFAPGLFSDASTVNFIASGAGAVARSLQDKNRDIVSVFDYFTAAQIADVAGRTGALDVTTAIETAMAALEVGGVNSYGKSALYFPGGKYKTTTTIDIPQGLRIFGAGRDTTQIHYTGSGAAFHAGLPGTGGATYYQEASQMSIYLEGNNNNIGIDLEANIFASMRHLYIQGLGNVAGNANIGIRSKSTDQAGGVLADAMYNEFQHVWVNHCLKGIQILRGGTEEPSPHWFVNCYVSGDYNGGAGIATCVGITFDDDNTFAPPTEYVSGAASVLLGGKIENCQYGVVCNGGPISVYGLSVESCAKKFVFSGDSWAINSIIGSHALDKSEIQDNSADQTNSFEFQHYWELGGVKVGRPRATGIAPTSRNAGYGVALHSTMCGYDVLYRVTTGDYNTAIGYQAARAITAGQKNVAVGYTAGTSLVGGDTNTLIGTGAGNVLTEGNDNVAVGNNALVAAITSGQNTGVGTQAMDSLVGDGVTEGINNSALGYLAGAEATTGSNNTFLGAEAGNTGMPGGAVTTGSNQVCVGNNNVANAFIKVAWTVTSDERDKIDRSAIDPDKAIAFVERLAELGGAITYRFDDRSRYWVKNDDGSIDKTHAPDGSKADKDAHAGLSAQKVMQAMQDAGLDHRMVVDDRDPEHLRLTETRLIPYYDLAIARLSARNNALTAILVSKGVISATEAAAL